ncbi:MAG: hypothetical protein FWH07_01830 [Oscillospiraceae bacterium]|nr:hypothetical protein [Oscillospiraceae bacterium]
MKTRTKARTRKIISIMLAITMLCSIFPGLPSFAEPVETERFEWKIGPTVGSDPNVTRTNNTAASLLILDNIGLTEDDIPIILEQRGANLDFNYIASAGSNRRFLTWTDLSVNAGDPITFLDAVVRIDNVTFATSANIDAKQVIVTDPRINTGDSAGRLTIPAALLYDEATDTLATKIYFAMGIDAGFNGGNADRYTGVNDLRGGEFNLLDKINLQVYPCECGDLVDCIDCAIHIFPFPLESQPTQIWAAGVQQGWESARFTNPFFPKDSETSLTRIRGGARYMVLEFNEAPLDWAIRFQTATAPAWWAYHLNYEEEPGVPAIGQMKSELPGGRVRYVIDFNTAFPQREMPAAGDSAGMTALHPGYDLSALFGTFQVVFHTNPTADDEQDWERWMAKVSSIYLTNHDPNDFEPHDELEFASEALVEAHRGHSTSSIDARNREGLKVYYDYTASGIDAVRLQYSIDQGNTWHNIHRNFSIMNTRSAPTGKRMEILPVETYGERFLELRWIPHRAWGQTAWGNATFRATNIKVTSGLQNADIPRGTSPVLAIANPAESTIDMLQRERREIDSPVVTLRAGAPASTSRASVWTSDRTSIVRVIDNETGATVRALDPGTLGSATLRIAAAADPSVYTEMTVKVTSVAAPNRQYTITSPYQYVDWDTFGQYKSAFHTHTLNSDGANSTAETAERFYELGYNVAAFTDHSVTTVTPDLVGKGPMSPRRIAEMRDGKGRNGNAGLIFIPGGNEHSSLGLPELTPTHDRGGHHVNTYFSFISSGGSYRIDSSGVETGTKIRDLVDSINTENRGAIAHINHPGRYTLSQWETPWATAEAIANSSANFKPYADLYRFSHSIPYMEIINKFDTESQAERVLWDNVLSETMPEGIPVWGGSSDDSHANAAIGFSYNILLMEELELSNVRDAMNNGTSFAFARVDRQYQIYPQGIDMWDWDANTEPGTPLYSRTRAVLDMPVPKVTEINVDNEAGAITIDAQITLAGASEPTVIDGTHLSHTSLRPSGSNNRLYIDWYADGIRIHRGKTLVLADHELSLFSYVRAQVVSLDYGVLYVQPFGIQVKNEERTKPNLVSVSAIDDSIEFRASQLNVGVNSILPAAARITTNQCTASNPRFATIKWDLSVLDEIDHKDPATWTFDIPGKIVLPVGMKEITNTDNVNLDVKVTALFMPPTKSNLIVEFGEEYYYYGRTHAEFMQESLTVGTQEEEEANGWTLAKASIGFVRDPETEIPEGAGPGERGDPDNHTFTYFKKTFELDENIDLDNVIGITGRHNIDDSMVLFINGVEVYRFNIQVPGEAGNSDIAGIGDPVEWDKYSGVNLNPNVIPFNINTDYGPVIGGSNAYHSASRTNFDEALQLGTDGVHVLTAAVGQNSRTSSDLLFDVELQFEFLCSHNITSLVPLTEATCLEPSSIEAWCLDCEFDRGLLLEEVLPAKGHGDWCNLCPECDACDLICEICPEPDCGLCVNVCEANGGHVGPPPSVCGENGDEVCMRPFCEICYKCEEGEGDTKCLQFDCEFCNPENEWFALGSVRGEFNATGEPVANIFDVLEILKFIVGMDSVISSGNETITAAESKRVATLSANANAAANPAPNIFCVLEVLKYIVGMDSVIDGKTITLPAPEPPPPAE